MAKGFGFASKAAAEIAARSGSSLWGGKLIFKLPNDGDSAIVRFIPDDDGEFSYGAWHHEVPVEGRAWGNQIPCLAQDENGDHTDDECPGCDADLKMKFKGYVLLIWRDGPVYKTDEKGKIVKDNMGDPVVLDHKDQIAIWSSGPRLFENLGEIHEAYKLGSRDFRVKRKGDGTDTSYSVVPKDVDGGAQPMSAADKKLAKEHDIDLSEFIRPPSLENWKALLEGGGTASSNGASGEQAAETAKSTNPFKRKK